jgi:hypothetical protein
MRARRVDGHHIVVYLFFSWPLFGSVIFGTLYLTATIQQQGMSSFARDEYVVLKSPLTQRYPDSPPLSRHSHDSEDSESLRALEVSSEAGPSRQGAYGRYTFLSPLPYGPF